MTIVHPKKRMALEAAGWRFGDAADFLGMSDEERQLPDTRFEIASAVRQQRERVNLSQKELAKRIKTSQPRIARIERAASDVSLDQLLRAFSAAGGRISVKQVPRSRSTRSGANATRGERISTATVIELQLA
ncbi:MAG TPA: helix-turn-helix transcriptional regulator [Pirellulales bacterium]|jgi:ribosome-binding protein aMBF1 (putative translation factor)|nr:helix-turn-helix transcriptional regulator [Pirellulales bacterium]